MRIGVLEALRLGVSGGLGHVELCRRPWRSGPADRLMDHRRVHGTGRPGIEKGRGGRKLRPLHADGGLGWQCGEHVLGTDHRLAADAELVPYRLELRLEDVVLLAELHYPLLEHHVVESPLLPGPLGGLVVAPPTVPVAVVLLVVRYELPLLALRK